MQKMKSNLFIPVAVAMLSGISFVLYLLEFPLFAFLGHLKMDFSDIPALFAGIAFGPFYSVLVELIKNILELSIKGVGTQMGFGNLMNFIVGSAFVFPFSLIFRKLSKKSEKKAYALSSVTSLFSMVLFGFGANYFITPLFFKYFLGVELDSKTLWAAIASATVLNLIKAVMLSLSAVPLEKILVKRLKKYFD